MPVADKTGTAENAARPAPRLVRGLRADRAVPTAPDGRVVGAPELAIAVVLENAGEGSEVAAPLFRRVVELYYGIEVTPFPWGG